MNVDVLSRIDWKDDRFALEGYVFHLQHRRSGSTADDGFVLYKRREQLEQYQRLLQNVSIRPRTVLELGIWDGGSTAFWTEVLHPQRYCAIDLQERGDSPYFTEWLAARGHGRVTTHWGVAQDDPEALARLLEQGLLPLDMVIDDASHMPGPSARSFEILFPRLQPGGLYVLEDWAWALQPEFQSATHPWAVLPSLHGVVHRLVELHGSAPELITAIHVMPDLVAVERGTLACDSLDIAAAIARRPRPWLRIAATKARHGVARARRAVATVRAS